MRFTVYKNSIFATIVSISASMCVALGIFFAFSGEIVGGIIIVIIGFVLMGFASNISERKKFKDWKKIIDEQGLIQQIQISDDFAISIYDTYPSSRSLAYISSLNPSAGQKIRALICDAANKEKSRIKKDEKYDSLDICPNCGNEVVNTANYCRHCGHDLSEMQK